MLSSLTLENRAIKKIDGGELWLSKNDLIGRKLMVPGIVNLINKKGGFVAAAFISPGSSHYIRIISRSKEALDKNYWRKKILSAYERRNFLKGVTNAYRVVYAESDGMPSVVIDKYNDVWAVQITSTGAETIKNDLTNIVIAEFKPMSLILNENLFYGTTTLTTVFEGSQKFGLDVLTGQKTGAYLDYRNLRLKARELAHGKCLDLFCYQGWFSCQIAGQVKKVIAVDVSEAAIEAGKINSRINGHKNIEFIKSDVFDFLDSTSEKFDFIHVDPPSFVKKFADLKPALLGYQKLIKKSLKLLDKKGVVLISSCSQKVTEGLLEKTILKTLNEEKIKAEIIFRGIQDGDHPVLKNFPQSLYLKAIAIKLFA